MKRVLLLVPTYNEAENIRPLVEAIKRAFAGQRRYGYEVLFIDDNSPDGTAGVIASLRGTDPRLHVLSGEKAGLGAAYVRGMAWGKAAGAYDVFVMMDADLSHDPADIPRLLKQLEAGADYVIGSRYAAGGRVARGYSTGRHIQSLIANRIAATLLDIPRPPKDLTAGFKAIRVSALQDIPLESIRATGYVFQVCLVYEFARRGYQIREVATVFHSRQRGQSKLGWRDIVGFLLDTYRLNPSARLQRAVRFAFVGASGTLVNLAILLALVHAAHFQPRIAYLAALEGSILSNFMLNHLFTFRNLHTNGLWKSFARKLASYNLVALVGATIAWLTFNACVSWLGLHYVAADLFGIVLAMGWNYWLSIRIVWPLVDNEPLASLELPTRELQKV